MNDVIEAGSGIAISNLEPKAIWKHFAEICRIPHATHNEQQLARFIADFGEVLGLETIIDEVNNVIIRKPATLGMEKHKTVILQTHLDMVRQKDIGLDFDFEKDSIIPYIDADWVKAKGTTLGADNGIGIAATMAVLEANNLKHGPIEAVFTVDEEEFFTGALHICKNKTLKGDIVLNLDSEEEDTLFIGSAGGVTTTSIFQKQMINVPSNSISLKIDVNGLHGGHSGADIHRGYANAIKLLVRVLSLAAKRHGLHLASISGGSAFTAIPRQASAKIVIQANLLAKFAQFITEQAKIIKNEYAKTEPDLKISIAEITPLTQVLAPPLQNKLLTAIYACQNGVIAWSQEMSDLVETSSNLGIVETTDNEIKLTSYQRSGINSARDNIMNAVNSAFSLAGAENINNHKFSGWKANLQSEILNIMKRLYQQLFNEPAKITAIHAALECGLFLEAFPHLDMISFGPTIKNAHNSTEKVNIASVEKFWKLLTLTLENIPEVR